MSNSREKLERGAWYWQSDQVGFLDAEAHEFRLRSDDGRLLSRQLGTEATSVWPQRRRKGWGND